MLLETVSGESFKSIFDKIIYGKEDFMDFLKRGFKGFWLEVLKSLNRKLFMATWIKDLF